MSAKEKKDGMDLGGDLSALLSESPAPTGGFIEIALDSIEEDPNQPRREDNPGFSQISIAELAATVRARGVKSPISVREKPDGESGYIINHGARRFRASKVAGKKTIPAFIDNDYNEADQVIENLQRNELTAREIADFIGRELAKGVRKGVIAKSIGKSAAFVSQHVTLLELPDVIADAFNTGRVSDVTAINELVTLFKSNPDEVELWLLDDEQEISRATVKLLREFIETRVDQDESQEQSEADADADADADGEDLSPAVESEKSFDEAELDADDFSDGDEYESAEDQFSDWEKEDGSQKSEHKAELESDGEDFELEEYVEDEDGYEANENQHKADDPTVIKKLAIRVLHDERLAILDLKRKPAVGHGWLKYEDDGYEFQADLNEVKLVSVGEL